VWHGILWPALSGAGKSRRGRRDDVSNSHAYDAEVDTAAISFGRIWVGASKPSKSG
jgi:hypothetical protein